MKYDVIIIGGACAGLSSAIYSSRRALKTLVLTKDIGGQAAMTTEIENYPGTGVIKGPELMNKFKEQAESFGAEIQFAEVVNIEKKDDVFFVKSSIGDFESSSIIIAFGLKHRELGAKGEKEFFGRGVTYCATCDGPLFKGKTVAVVGGGNSAFDAAEYLSALCTKVYLIHRSEDFRAEQVLIDAVKGKENVELLTFSEIKEISGERKVSSIKLLNNKTNEEKELSVDGIFVEIGYEPQTKIVKDLVKLNERGYIVIDNECKTSLPGAFAAGDVTDTPFKQAVISAGEGAKAALAAVRYLQNLNGVNAVASTPDWTRIKAT